MKSIQEQHAPTSRCFGCGPANDKGLRIQSFPTDEPGVYEARFRPEAHHEAFPGMLNGGIIGSLLDCHSNWTAAMALADDDSVPPCTVTADFHVKLRRPTPSGDEVYLVARPTEVDGKKAVIEAELHASGKVCATCKGTFVAVGPDHPAYHRW